MAATTLLRAALPSIPVVNQLPGVRKTGGDPSSLHEVRSATVARDHVTSYAAVCGFPVKDVAPLTFPHVLAFPLHMAVLTSPEFPFPAIGTVHLANTITQHRPVAVGETLLLEVHTSAVRAHPKGRTIDFLATAMVGEETVWESTSTYLRRGRDNPDAEVPNRPDHVVPGRVTWRLGGDVGRRYAAVSGDHNPIHLYPLTAKALGFPRQIAHGMWSLARCVAALENRLPDAVTVDAAFKKPIFLPGTVAFGQDPAEDGIAFALTSPTSAAPHVVGRSRPVS
ncbi:MaoC/PaaZ C-terminal domain-containing protein [Nocardioides sp.]|jgi:acyl dehydratase|uniref:MaoC/PaaZ C-terminal domain-containing protein n=1 Tax=Nocardioides sp. TaxID=35761 RepID=UPI002F4166B9